MNLRTLIGGALGGAALAVLAAAPTVLAKDSGSFSVDCLTSDSSLQHAEGDITTAPAQVMVSPANLWPPNHKMRNMNLSMSLTNNLTDPNASVPVSLTVSEITDDQVADDDAGGHGCGRPSDKQGPDWAPADINSNPLAASGDLSDSSPSLALSGVQLRGERCAKDGVRVYTIAVTCCDNTNAQNPVCDSSPELLQVTVPKSRGHHS
jgi:hypothetical protein